MPPPLPTSHRGMTANPVKPGRYRPGKAIAEEPSSEEEEEEDEDENEKAAEIERRRQAEAKRKEEHLKLIRKKKQEQPKATSFPSGAAGGIAKGVEGVKIEEKEDDDEEGFVTEEEDEREREPAKVVPQVGGEKAASVPAAAAEESEEEEEDDEEEESSEEESSSEEEAPRVLLRPTFIKKDKRNNTPAQGSTGQADVSIDADAQKAQRREKADMLIRDQLEKDAIARSSANRAWDDDEAGEAGEEGAIDDTDGLDAEAEYAAWKLRELKRVKRGREAIEEAEKEREEVERRRNLTAEEREREDREFITKQREERDATRGQTGFMKRYFHKGAFFQDDLAKEGLDRRNVMGSRFVDDVSRETLPEYMQVRDLTKIGKKGRTRYRDLRSEDTGQFGQGLDSRSRGRRDGPPAGITDERFLPDRPEDRKGPTGANASAVRDRRRLSSRSRSPRRDGDYDRYIPDGGSRRKRSPSPYEDRDKRRRTENVA
ncbi:micro-fibrillar-associated protein [Aspergillus sclerotialis]|uniref:Micro-fibrillar-associated protein n=1 Tax=Aspergillus sclerotialis TaxID=2070753 RepID=A0A3A2ZPT7_9EURO|nr:micro-fibrillar-associated protein [Aspergillus sclerotialis]